MIARGRNGARHPVGRNAGDGGDFVDAEAFDGVQDESLAMVADYIAQSGGDEAHHFVGADDLFGRGYAVVGDDGFFGDGFVGLVELQFGLVAGPDVRLAGRIFQVHGAAVGSIGAGEFIERIHGQAVEPGFEREALRFFAGRRSPSPPRAAAMVSSITSSLVMESRHNLVGSFAEINFAFHEALEAGEIHVDVGAHVLGRNRRGKHHGQRVLEGNGNILPGRTRPFAGASTCAWSAAVLCAC